MITTCVHNRHLFLPPPFSTHYPPSLHITFDSFLTPHHTLPLPRGGSRIGDVGEADDCRLHFSCPAPITWRRKHKPHLRRFSLHVSTIIDVTHSGISMVQLTRLLRPMGAHSRSLLRLSVLLLPPSSMVVTSSIFSALRSRSFSSSLAIVLRVLRTVQ